MKCLSASLATVALGASSALAGVVQARGDATPVKIKGNGMSRVMEKMWQRYRLTDYPSLLQGR